MVTSLDQGLNAGNVRVPDRTSQKKTAQFTLLTKPPENRYNFPAPLQFPLLEPPAVCTALPTQDFVPIGN